MRHHIFADTVQKSEQWCKETADELGWKPEEGGYSALRATLHELRDRLPVDESAHFASNLPMLLRGMYFDGWRPSAVPEKIHRDELLRRIRGHFPPGEDVDAEAVARAVLRVVARHVPEGSVQKLKSLLPHDLRDLFSADRAVEMPQPGL